jgi:hypothetical protein
MCLIYAVFFEVLMLSRSQKVRTIGPESKPPTLAKLDQRTREAALIRRTRSELLAHIGNPTVVQLALVERASWLTLRVNLLEAKLSAGGEMSDHAAKSYIAFSNALRRTLADIGIQPGKSPTPTIAEIFARPTQAKTA